MWLLLRMYIYIYITDFWCYLMVVFFLFGNISKLHISNEWVRKCWSEGVVGSLRFGDRCIRRSGACRVKRSEWKFAYRDGSSNPVREEGILCGRPVNRQCRSPTLLYLGCASCADCRVSRYFMRGRLRQGRGRISFFRCSEKNAHWNSLGFGEQWA